MLGLLIYMISENIHSDGLRDIPIGPMYVTYSRLENHVVTSITQPPNTVSPGLFSRPVRDRAAGVTGDAGAECSQ